MHLAPLFQRVILPLIDNWDWQYEGNCSNMSSEKFFHPDAERGTSRRDREEAGKAICVSCPVLYICREFALINEEPFGIWGGLSPAERLEILNSRKSNNL